MSNENDKIIKALENWSRIPLLLGGEDYDIFLW